jgi:hypothetical protein
MPVNSDVANRHRFHKDITGCPVSGARSFLQFLGKQLDDPMTRVTKQDVVAFGNSLITQSSAKTANHDLEALKTLFKLIKSARRH